MNSSFPNPKINDNAFSILIPTWNNLFYLKECIRSIRQYSTYNHQILVHVNEGKDGTLEWLQHQSDIQFTHSLTNIGVCHALNQLRNLAESAYLLYMNDDMFACPDWDLYLWEEVKGIGHNAFFLSSTAIEPVPQSVCSIKGDFGRSIHDFNEKALLESFDKFEKQDWNGATWTPSLVHTDFWDKVGGYSEEFSPGMYSDPDFSMKIWKEGVRYFKGVSKSRVYHFGSISTKRVKHNPGYTQFIKKWGITSGTFTNHFLKRGTPYNGLLAEPQMTTWIQLKSYYKKIMVNLFNS
jgi:GT2 family glycosyltransferase